MPNTKSTQITTPEAIKLIEEARNAELCRDINASRKILGAVLENLDDAPQIKGLETVLQANILRLCGFFLNNYGRSRNLKIYQERGKDFLTTAVEMFDRENLPDKSAEAKVMLALCYWHEGAISECEIILSETEAQFENNQLHPVYIQICVNRLMTHYWKNEFSKGLEIVNKLAVPIGYCKDARIKTMYHNQAGIIYQSLKQTDKAIYHLNEAIKAARQSGNLLFAAVNLNNLGNACKDVEQFEHAHQHVDESINIFTELQEYAWKAYPLDTKAQVYLAENKLASAVKKVDEALEIYRETKDYAGLADSLFTKIRILLRLNRVTEAILLSEELMGTCRQQIGEFAARKYASELAKLIYPLNNTSYQSEVKCFKTNLLRQHLTDADRQITKAAETLGISHQNLSNILNNQFSELYIELGIRRRAPRNGEKRDILKNIAPVKLSDSQMSCDSRLQLNEDVSYYTFALNGKHLPSLKTKQNAVVLVEASNQTAGATVIMQNQKNDEFHCGVLEMDKLTGIFYLNDSSAKDDFPYLLDDFKYYGKVVGYCLLEADSGSQILFRPF
jgi:tetratricopeptide (TPR) repeat protein